MKRTILSTAIGIVFCATILAGLAPPAWAADGGTCSTRNVAGSWGYMYTGSIVLPTGIVPVAAVGRFTLDAAGNLAGTQTRSNGGSSAEESISGLNIVNANCTATLTVNAFDQSGTPLRSAALAVVYVNNRNEVRAIFKSLTLANGTNLPVVVTIEAKRIFTGDGD